MARREHRNNHWRRLLSRDGYTAVSHIFVMEWAAVLRNIITGLLIAGAVGAWVPDAFWRHLFLTGHPLASKLGAGKKRVTSPNRAARLLTAVLPGGITSGRAGA